MVAEMGIAPPRPFHQLDNGNTAWVLAQERRSPVVGAEAVELALAASLEPREGAREAVRTQGPRVELGPSVVNSTSYRFRHCATVSIPARSQRCER